MADSTQINCVHLHDADNILVCTRHIRSGETIRYLAGSMAALEDVSIGHKIALADLGTGDKVYRYGAPIGSMTQPVSRGGHVHIHNLKSDYIGIHDRQGKKNS
ncbi:UxaA family hydrolase [Parvularcula flava]|nr:UxaA family hydrolase [Aquisalinus luteolus]